MDTPPAVGRVHVADSTGMRRAGWRTVRAGLVVILLLTGFTAGGITMLISGEGPPAVPFAVGGLIAQLAVLGIVIAVLRVRATLVDDTVSRHALASARTTLAVLRMGLLAALGALIVYAVIRAVQGDPWTTLTAVLIGLVLALLTRGAGRLRDGLDAVTAPIDETT